ncbi:MAG: hypothetical protein QOF73_1364 [Thermomicrobiales bacterium]|nr:hypothetical protein [Thermomicrobiales bacterium]
MSRRPPRDGVNTRTDEAGAGRQKADDALASSPVSSRPDEPETQSSPVTGVVGDASATRSGDDVRRRGWFWHWNSIVTQFAPLIGLKGVGLLNSYTVWTDRREESPHRGYAFPSQQSEADFYGEDRAELIAINKILVALDLIEIRKEMVLRVDEQGRRWRVPHNFYRVKDHGDSFVLGSGDVLRVVELADRDQAIYRYVRHIFSSRFAPIDPDNVWTRILVEVRQNEVWQRLAARAGRDEDRASARTRAGHAARKANLGTPERRDTATTADTQNDSDDVVSDGVEQTSVVNTNNGSDHDVAPTNNGFDGSGSTVVDLTNTGQATSVEPSNRTYNQFGLTTTTTDDGSKNIVQPHGDRVPQQNESPAPASLRQSVPGAGAGLAPALTTMHVEVGPGGRPAPADAAGEATAIRAFEDANGRRSTPAERQLLRGLAERFAPAARDQARPELPSGWAWLTAAIYEAVEAGSSFVAPRRLREILSRWEREGAPGGEAEGREGEKASSAQVSPPVRLPASPPSGPIRLGEAPDIPLPHGFGSRRTWDFAVSLLGSAIDRERLVELVAGTAIVGYLDGEVTLAAPDAAQAERIAGEYRELIARKLSEAMRRPVRIAVLTAVGDGETERRRDGETEGKGGEVAGFDHEDEEPETPAFVVEECGLPSGQVWAAVLEEVAARGGVGRANFDAWLRTTALIGRGDGGSLVVGVPHALAQRRIAARFVAPLRSAAAAIVGADLPLEVVVAREWLRAHSFRASEVPLAPSLSRKEGA